MATSGLKGAVGDKFKVVDDDTVSDWQELYFPIASTSPFDLSNTLYYINIGLFMYDTTML